ncbi:hypothetical protein PR048_008124 [Dryococelus australis]|uniref:Uncharacterized protein n=1 Tax=Dryococelus australis TaxID=614101 RepID=A0ABQ9HW67_9NEOP|nr:hypothetical protein PR048_008124 [Dryococelus australis]
MERNVGRNGSTSRESSGDHQHPPRFLHVKIRRESNPVHGMEGEYFGQYCPRRILLEYCKDNDVLSEDCVACGMCDMTYSQMTSMRASLCAEANDGASADTSQRYMPLDCRFTDHRATVLLSDSACCNKQQPRYEIIRMSGEFNAVEAYVDEATDLSSSSHLHEAKFMKEVLEREGVMRIGMFWSAINSEVLSAAEGQVRNARVEDTVVLGFLLSLCGAGSGNTPHEAIDADVSIEGSYAAWLSPSPSRPIILLVGNPVTYSQSAVTDRIGNCQAIKSSCPPEPTSSPPPLTSSPALIYVGAGIGGGGGNNPRLVISLHLQFPWPRSDYSREPVFSRRLERAGRVPAALALDVAFGKLSGDIWAALKGTMAGKREIPKNTRRPAALSGTIPTTCEDPRVTRPGLNPEFPDHSLSESPPIHEHFSSRDLFLRLRCIELRTTMPLAPSAPSQVDAIVAFTVAEMINEDTQREFLRRLKDLISRKRLDLPSSQWQLLHKTHLSIQHNLSSSFWQSIEFPMYGSHRIDFAPFNIFISPKTKFDLKGIRFQDVEKVQENATRHVLTIPDKKFELASAIEQQTSFPALDLDSEQEEKSLETRFLHGHFERVNLKELIDIPGVVPEGLSGDGLAN